MQSRPLKILIVGGGIAGCSAGIALSDRGHDVRIVEKQDAWKFQSSGIFVYSNGLVCLGELGLLDDILQVGFEVPDGRNVYFDHRGAHIVDTVYPRADGGRIPAILGIKRAEMHRVMSRRVEDLGVPVRLGTTVTSIRNNGECASVELSNGVQEEYDLVIGADGVRSSIRAMIGMTVEPRYSGFGVWRSVHRRPPDLRDKIMMMGRSVRYGIMPISEDLLYTFGTLAEPEGKYYDPARWPETMRDKFADFAGAATPFLEELGNDSEILYTAVEEVALPLPWHRGRVLLIGDAAHASTPFMGQGGAMAMQDAVVLANALSFHDSIEDALDRFGKARLPVCQFVQDVSRAVGEAGAREIAGDLEARNVELRDTAQAKVDSFYSRLEELNRQAEQTLKQVNAAA